MSIWTRESDTPESAGGSPDRAAVRNGSEHRAVVSSRRAGSPEGQLAQPLPGASFLRPHSMRSIFWERFRRHQMALVGAVILFILVAGSALGPWFFTREARFNQISCLWAFPRHRSSGWGQTK